LAVPLPSPTAIALCALVALRDVLEREPSDYYEVRKAKASDNRPAGLEPREVLALDVTAAAQWVRDAAPVTRARLGVRDTRLKAWPSTAACGRAMPVSLTSSGPSGRRDSRLSPRAGVSARTRERSRRRLPTAWNNGTYGGRAASILHFFLFADGLTVRIAPMSRTVVGESCRLFGLSVLVVN